ncbi:MAG: acyltransferase [Muribaculaceae bacterium]
MNNNGRINHDRVVFIDYIRVVACFLVMLVHASENFYAADSSGLAGCVSMLVNEDNRFWVAFYDGTLGRISVPLFMIVSAFLLVPMKSGYTMTSFYKRRLLRVVPPMVVFMFAYTFLPLLWNGMTWEQSMTDLKHLPFNFPSMAGHLWFMYPLISVYLIIPVVSPWLERASARDERVFLALFFVSSFTPFVHKFITPEVWGECFWNGYGMFWYVSGYFGYLVLAHYVRVHIKWSRAKRMRIGAAAAVVGMVFTGWSFWVMGTPGVLIDTPMLEWAWEFCTPNIIIATFGVFLMFSCIERRSTPRVIAELSRLSFGIYLIHLFFLAPIAAFFVNGNQAEPLIPVALAIPAIAVLAFICSAAAIKVLSLLPGSKYTVGC